MTTTLHSKLGASSSDRWMNCAGSISLIESLKLPEDEEADGSPHAARGTLAHWVGSECLDNGKDAWEYSGHKETVGGHEIVLDADDMAAVQKHLDYIRGQRGVSRLLVEHAFHVPEVHEQFWGTADAVVISEGLVEVVDYKHGIGVQVDAERNTQLMMYAAGAIITLQIRRDAKVKLTIVQPRGWHLLGPIRSWETTAGEILDWVDAEWKPAAARTDNGDAPLITGKWCRFCTARLDCPATNAAIKRLASMKDTDMTKLTDWALAEVKADCDIARIVEKAAGDEIFMRLKKGSKIPGWKIVPKKADRVFKDGVEPKAVEAFGDLAFDRKLKSPAVLEKMPGGGVFVKEWAYKPDTGLTLAPDTDARAGVSPRTREEAFGAKKPVASDF